MVKLVRLASQDTTGLFNNLFNDDIVLKKNSKVALQSMTCEISTQQVTIDAQNDALFCKLSYGDKANVAYKECHLTHGVYNSTSFPTLLGDATTKLNSLSVHDTTDIGKQWEVSIVNKKVTFNVKYGTFIQPEKPQVAALVGLKNVGVSTLATAFIRTGGTPLTDDAFMWFKSPNCKGSSSFSAQISTATKTGFVLAYLLAPPDSNTATIDPATIAFGLRHTGTLDSAGALTQDGYIFYKDGVQDVSTTVKPALNDYLSLDIGEGKIKGNIYRGANSVIEIFSYDYDHQTDLFPVLIFNGDATSRANLIRFNSDPVYNVTNFQAIQEPQVEGTPPGSNTALSIKSLKFGDIDLALIFGFKTTEYFSISTNTDSSFIADRVFQMSDFADSFVIELLNIPLDSYDGLTSQRRNILHTIVQTDAVRERLTYTAPYPLYIDLKNANDILLRNIQARLLREDLSAVILNGFSQITLLISE